ncbi:hypothetical protein CW309_19645 [Pseudomonas hunanensis]|nr:hypothetical protein CW309_19645 [Pseudomonas hunanensis]
MLPTPSKPWLERRPCATPVGADSSANTGRAGAKLRGACFAGKPAPTGHPGWSICSATTKRRLGITLKGWGAKSPLCVLLRRKGQAGRVIHSSKCQCSRTGSPRKRKAVSQCLWSIADMDDGRSLSSCFVPGR